jgi:hypothetical protein
MDKILIDCDMSDSGIVPVNCWCQVTDVWRVEKVVKDVWVVSFYKKMYIFKQQ